jgi:hypothetical protein
MRKKNSSLFGSHYSFEVLKSWCNVQGDIFPKTRANRALGKKTTGQIRRVWLWLRWLTANFGNDGGLDFHDLPLTLAMMVALTSVTYR